MRNCQICSKLSSISDITNITISLVDDINLNNKLNVKFCNECKFYFSDSSNNQEDYNEYYLKFNNYQQQIYCPDKDERCANFIFENINKNEIKTILDYGSGNGVLANLLSKEFSVEIFDIDMEKNTKQYDLLVLSHVLEHIYDVNNFIKEISKILKIKD
jgi:2-polyprenyl-3-methyl-5-hydroxy-6-metoxy-1,4-benzoquinol methylase